MDDTEFILFLVKLLWDEVSDGDTPEDKDFNVIRDELLERGIDPDEAMPF